ncbi:MAG: MFS transporter [Bacillota bacterium]
MAQFVASSNLRSEQLSSHYWRNFILLALDSGSFAFAITSLSHLTIIPSYLAHITSSKVLLGIAPTIFVLGSLLPQAFVANWANGLKRRKPYLVAAFISERVAIALLYLATSAATRVSPGALLVLFLGAYTAFTTTLGLSSPVYTDFVAKAINARRGSFYGFSFFLGSLSGVVSGRLATRTLNALPFPASYMAVFRTALIVTALSLTFCLMLAEPPVPDGRRRMPWREFISELGQVLHKDIEFTRFIGVRNILNLGEMATGFYALYCAEKFSLPAGEFATFTVVLFISQSLANLAWGHVGDRVGFKVVLASAAALGVVSTALAVSSTTPWMFLLVFPLVGATTSAAQIANVNLAIGYSPFSQTQTYVGLMNTLQAPSLAMMPVIGGLIAERAGYPATMVVAGCLYSVGFFITSFALRDPAKGSRPVAV